MSLSSAPTAQQARASRASRSRCPLPPSASAEPPSRRTLLSAALSLPALLLLSRSSAAQARTVPTGSAIANSIAQKEAEAEAELNSLRAALAAAEAESVANRSDLQLCATPLGVDVVGITETIALVGSVAGGLAARQSKVEVDKLNEKLRVINLKLRQQSRAPGGQPLPGLSTVAPSLNYAPQTQFSPPAEASPAPVSPVSVEAPDELRLALREGRVKLKESNGAAALPYFKKALMLSRQAGSREAERRATRGMAVARRLLGDRQGAIEGLLSVLAISQALGERTGDTDALGMIADIYTELGACWACDVLPSCSHARMLVAGDLDRAGIYYDKYISRLQGDDGNVD